MKGFRVDWFWLTIIVMVVVGHIWPTPTKLSVHADSWRDLLILPTEVFLVIVGVVLAGVVAAGIVVAAFLLLIWIIDRMS